MEDDGIFYEILQHIRENFIDADGHFRKAEATEYVIGEVRKAMMERGMGMGGSHGGKDDDFDLEGLLKYI